MVEVDKTRLLEYVERIEEYDNVITDANNSKKVIFEEAKAEGFSKKGINYVIRQRKKDRDEIEEEKELFKAYAKAANLE